MSKGAKTHERGENGVVSGEGTSEASGEATPTKASQASPPATRGLTFKPWWERWPGLLDEELGALENSNIRYELDEEARRKAGVIRLRVFPRVDGEELELVATYSDFYPYFRFEISGSDLGHPHHQHPFSGNLCLIGRSTENWSVDDNLADFLQNRLPVTLRAARAGKPEDVRDMEELQAEPFSDYYPYEGNSCLLIDSDWRISGQSGSLTIGLELTDPPVLVRGAVLEVRDEEGGVSAKAHRSLGDLYPVRVRGRWCRSAEPIRRGEASAFVAEIAKRNPRFAVPDWQGVGSGSLDVIGVLFPEEVSWRAMGEGWVFAIRYR